MQAAELPNDDVILIVSRDDLRLINNSVNEAIEELDDDEFGIRLGSTKIEARALRQAFRELYERLDSSS